MSLRQIEPNLRRQPTPLRWIILGFAAVAALVSLIVIVALLVSLHHRLAHQTFYTLDHWLPNFLHQFASRPLTTAMLVLTTIGSPLVVSVLMLCTLGVLLVRKRWGEAYGMALSEFGALLLNQVAKSAFHRQRPSWTWAFVHERNFSFPSGHAMLGIVSFGTIAYLMCRYFRQRGQRVCIIVVAFALVGGIGLSRIYLGVHYPSDILAGWLAGGLWLIFIAFWTELLHRIVPEVRAPEDQRKPADVPSQSQAN